MESKDRAFVVLKENRVAPTLNDNDYSPIAVVILKEREILARKLLEKFNLRLSRDRSHYKRGNEAHMYKVKEAALLS